MITDINSEDRLVQQTFAEHLRDRLGWESVYAYNAETFGPHGTLGRASEREAVLVRDLREALVRLNPDLPELARARAALQPSGGPGLLRQRPAAGLHRAQGWFYPSCSTHDG